MADKATNGSERRRSARKHLHRRVQVRRLGLEEDPFSAQVMNISDGGVRFVCAMPLHPEERLHLVIGEEDYTAKVLECRELYDGFAVRAEFILAG